MSEEEVQPGESESATRRRIAFLRSFKGLVKNKDQLASLAQVYANIKTLGCVYPPEIMERVNSMAADVKEDPSLKLPEKRKLVLASQGRAHATAQREATNGETNGGPPTKRPMPPALIDRLKQIKHKLMIADKRATGLSMLNMATSQLGLSWQLRAMGGETSIQIEDVIVLRHSFGIRDAAVIKECCINSVIDSFLEGSELEIHGNSLHFAGHGPEHTYSDCLERNLVKAARHFPAEAVGLKALQVALDRVNMTCVLDMQQLQGWEQQAELRAGGLTLGTRILRKGECARVKADAAIEELVGRVAETIRKGEISFEQLPGLPLSLVINN